MNRLVSRDLRSRLGLTTQARQLARPARSIAKADCFARAEDRTQCLDGFYDREPAALCAANFMSGLCPTPSDFANKKIALNHFFYPQSYPQQVLSRNARKSPDRLFFEAVRAGKTAAGLSPVEKNGV
ncbi:MAG: hypothetical protein KF819_22450 [Labilithrix sp.]|nr:hypothetical protein [Labilithrix sp.]